MFSFTSVLFQCSVCAGSFVCFAFLYSAYFFLFVFMPWQNYYTTATYQPIVSSLENNIRRITLLSHTHPPFLCSPPFAHKQRTHTNTLQHPEYIMWLWRNEWESMLGSLLVERQAKHCANNKTDTDFNFIYRHLYKKPIASIPLTCQLESVFDDFASILCVVCVCIHIFSVFFYARSVSHFPLVFFFCAALF